MERYDPLPGEEVGIARSASRAQLLASQSADNQVRLSNAQPGGGDADRGQASAQGLLHNRCRQWLLGNPIKPEDAYKTGFVTPMVNTSTCVWCKD